MSLCCQTGKKLNSNYLLELYTLLRVTQTLRMFVSNRETISNPQAVILSSPSLYGAVKVSCHASPIPR